MDPFELFLIIGTVVVILILQFDKLQRRKLNKILQETKNVQPLFMVQASVQKVNAMRLSLMQLSAAIALSNYQGEQLEDLKNSRQYISNQLDEITAKYHSGEITVLSYNEELDELGKILKDLSEELTPGARSQFI